MKAFGGCGSWLGFSRYHETQDVLPPERDAKPDARAKDAANPEAIRLELPDVSAVCCPLALLSMDIDGGLLCCGLWAGSACPRLTSGLQRTVIMAERRCLIFLEEPKTATATDWIAAFASELAAFASPETRNQNIFIVVATPHRKVSACGVLLR